MMQIVFVAPNDQAQIERGFSVNMAIVIENLEAESLRSQRLVYDSIKATPKKENHEIEIGNKILLSCKSASSRYKLALEENRKTKNDPENDGKRQMITEEVENDKRRRMEVQSYIGMLNKDIDPCCQEGEEKHEISYFLKANALRKTIQDKEDIVKILDDAFSNLQKEEKEFK